MTDNEATANSTSTAQPDWEQLSVPNRVLWPNSFGFNIAIALFIGFAYALYLCGPRPLNPSAISWLKMDSVTHYLGWAFYRQDTHLHWPITYTDRIGYPVGDSIALMDLNALLAVFF
jgi:hypothetical protein